MAHRSMTSVYPKAKPAMTSCYFIDRKLSREATQKEGPLIFLADLSPMGFTVFFNVT